MENHENLIHILQEHHLEMNEYKKHYDGVPIDDYINLLDMFILWSKTDRDYIKFQKEKIDFREKTIGEYKNDLIFSQVSILLTASKLSVAEISRKYGFCDPYHLSRRFKERFHQTPTEYRRANDIQK